MVQESRGTTQVSTDAVELHVIFMGSFHSSSSSLVKSNEVRTDHLSQNQVKLRIHRILMLIIRIL